MKLTERQRRLLSTIVRKSNDADELTEQTGITFCFTEMGLASVVKKSPECPIEYDFSSGSWGDVYERMEDFFKKYPFSREMHSDVEELISKGYVIRCIIPGEIMPIEPETLYGLWTLSDGFNRLTEYSSEFQMTIEGKRKKGNLEEIGGVILDDCGAAQFWGRRNSKMIKFTKLYHQNNPRLAHPDVFKSEINYQGKRNGDIYRGECSVTVEGNRYQGHFILTEKRENLPKVDSIN